VGLKIIIFVCGVLITGSSLALSFIKNFWIFMSVYFLGYAGPIGILYTIPVNAAYA